MESTGPSRRNRPLAAITAVAAFFAIYYHWSNREPPPSASAPPTTEVAQTQPAPVSRSALERLKGSAETGNLQHQLLLAVKYATGDGVVKNQAEAARWYLMAAQAGDPQAMYEVGMRYRHGHGVTVNETEANVWRHRAASAGIIEAQYEMAHMYGTVTSKGALISQQRNADPGESSRQLLMWLSRAAETGFAKAKHELAIVRLYGISKGGADVTGYLVPLPSVTAAAIQLLTENAEADYWDSQFALAELYQTGYADIKSNPSESNKWWQRLDAQTDASVQVTIARRYLVNDRSRYSAGANKWKGKNLSYDETNQVAFEWLSRAAAQGHAQALWHIATLKYNGIGTSKDLAGAVQDHRRAAELGEVEAMYYLAMDYAAGNRVPKDHAIAVHWLNKTVDHEGPYGRNAFRSQAQNALGAMHENGYGVSKDLLVAYALYSLAAAAGDPKANDNSSRVATLLKPEELVEAQGLTRDWRPGSAIARRTSAPAS